MLHLTTITRDNKYVQNTIKCTIRNIMAQIVIKYLLFSSYSLCFVYFRNIYIFFTLTFTYDVTIYVLFYLF